MSEKADRDAVRRYWQQPTGMDIAQREVPGLVELARDTINKLCDEIDDLQMRQSGLHALADRLFPRDESPTDTS